MPSRLIWPVFFILLSSATASAATSDKIDECLIDALRNAPDEATVGSLRESCESVPEASTRTGSGIVDERLRAEREIEDRPFSITPHKVNYVLPISYNSRLNREPWEFTGEADEFEDTEVNFQVSFKFPVVRDVFRDNGDLYFAYTNQSWWQLYAGDVSSPFRETNHEPELFFRFDTDWTAGNWRNTLVDLGFVHQSNGRADPLSRSWNRIFANFVLEKGDFAMRIKPWIVVGDIDDNPDIEDFLGYGDVRLGYVWNKHTFTGLLRNNLSTSDNKGAVELTWSYPLYGNLRWYTKYYYGYGESLIDYNAKSNRLGIGFALNDALQR